MAKGIQVLWIFVFIAANPVLSQGDEFVYNGFKGLGSNNISLSGGAEIENNGVLKLTNETVGVIGHAFYPTPIKFRHSTDGTVLSFSTAFAFSIVPEYERLGGHGFAFAVSPWKELHGALPRQYLGLVNATSNENSSNHLFAVEFDTVQDLEFKDMNDNHVGVDIDGLVSNYSVSAGYFVEHNSSKQELRLKSGRIIQAWIDYNSATQLVDVKLSLSSTKPSSSIISYRVDLSPILEDAMFVGFSASTGLLASHHYIHGWSFNMTGEAKSLDLSSLPSLPGPKQNRTPLIAGVTITTVSIVVIAIGIAFYIIRKMRNEDTVEAWELDVGPHRFSYNELKQATKGFRDKDLLGFGGFGRVYKGTLPNCKTQVAVKRISQESRQGMREFASEISTIGRLRHRHLVQLLGWCRRRSDLLLVYDFMPNGSLDKYIFHDESSSKVLSWEQRLKIIKGVASGLLYLHEEWEQTVIHRDIKAGNVLLDSDMNGRLGDFGLAKLYEHGANPSTTRVVGTLGYLAPELTRTGKPTTSSDMFAFGALLLEVVCGRRPIEPKSLPEELILVDWVWESWKEGVILNVVDPRLRGMYDEFEAVVVLKIGLMCSNDTPERRPTMRQVVRYLEGEVVLPEVVAPQDEYEGKKGGGGIGGFEFEDFVHSYPPSSSFFEKASAGSSGRDGDGSVNVEAGQPKQARVGGD